MIVGALMLGILCGAIAAVATLVAGGGAWLAFGAYSVAGCVGLGAGVVAGLRVPHRRGSVDPRRESDLAQWAADDDSVPVEEHPADKQDRVA